MKIVSMTAVAVILVIGASIDWKERRIPNWLTFSALLTGLFFHALFSGWHGLLFSVQGAATGFALLLLPYVLLGIGAGDVKLLMGTGAWLGTAMTFQSFLWAALIGTGVGIWVMLRNQSLWETLWTIRFSVQHLTASRLGSTEAVAQPIASTRMPYGMAIALGFFSYTVFGGLV